MKRPDVVCLGILVADVITRTVDELPDPGTLAFVDELALRGGGGALNTSTWLARSGVSAAAAGKVGADSFGRFLVELLSERGIERAGVVVDPDASTSATVVLVNTEGERTFLHRPGANGELRASDLDPDIVFAGRWLLLTGAFVLPALDGSPAAALLAEARRHGVRTALDTVFDPTGRWDRVLPLLPQTDLFMPSIAEARAITGEQDPSAVAATLHELGARDVALKLGPHGTYGSGEDFRGYIEPVNVSPIDGTGAGDAFNAAVLYGKLAGWPFEQALRLATAAGAYATTFVGAADEACDLAALVDNSATGMRA